MPVSPDCIICILRQTLEAVRQASDDEKVHLSTVLEAMRLVEQSGIDLNPPSIAQMVHRMIRERTNNQDPYLIQKRLYNTLLLEQFDYMKGRLTELPDPLELAIRWAIAGNSIDVALGLVSREKVLQALESAETAPLNGSVMEFRRIIEKSKSIFYLTDNTGEIVCDRLLIELLTGPKYNKQVIVGVRGKPILNDATREDAAFVGLTEVPILDNGNDGVGTILEQCSEDFLKQFQEADLVIAKGLANLETLLENKGPYLPKQIVFLFKSKCPFISNYAGTTFGDLVIKI